MKEKKISVGTFKVNCTLTQEMINDISKMTGIDEVMKIESELMRSYESDRRIEVRNKKIEQLLNG